MKHKKSTEKAISELVAKMQQEFVFAVFSAPKSRDSEILKIRLRPVLLRDQLYYQAASFTKTQCFTVNIHPDELFERLLQLAREFELLVVKFPSSEVHCQFANDGAKVKEVSLKSEAKVELTHNKTKNHILPEGQVSPLMQKLGIQNKDGKVIRQKHDKFKQINRFLEVVRDVLPDAKEGLKLVDFGCGRAYLTFALCEMLPDVSIVGVDVRDDVIAKSKALAESLDITNIQFVNVRIDEYQASEVDMVVALHACDTATDDAISFAIRSNAKIVLLAPCCQHEFAKQLLSEKNDLILKRNLLRERYATLLTDAVRAEVLEQFGYSVDMIEFVDPEHTPKNLLIRACKRRDAPTPNLSRLEEWLSSFAIRSKLVEAQRKHIQQGRCSLH